MLFVLLAFAVAVSLVVTNQYHDDDENSTSHLASISNRYTYAMWIPYEQGSPDYSCTVPLFNFAVQEPQIPLHNRYVSKQVVIPMHNFYSGQG